jgi:hypothetical protein
VGGLIDVVAASLLNWAVKGTLIVRQNSVRVMFFFPFDADQARQKKAAAEILVMSEGRIWDDIRESLLDVINEHCPEVESAEELENGEEEPSLVVVNQGRRCKGDCDSPACRFCRDRWRQRVVTPDLDHRD